MILSKEVRVVKVAMIAWQSKEIKQQHRFSDKDSAKGKEGQIPVDVAIDSIHILSIYLRCSFPPP